MKLFSVIATLAILAASAASASSVVSIDFAKNFDFIGGYDVTPVTGDGVTGNQGTGIAFDLESTGNDVWHSHFSPEGVDNTVGRQTLDVATDLGQVVKVHMLMNLWWGSYAPGVTKVAFVAANGFTQTFSLTGGVDIRDYNRTQAWPDSIDGGIAQPWWVLDTGSKRLDVLTFDLDDIFLTQSLTGITVTDDGASGQHRAFVAGISAEVSDIPVPASLPLLLAAMGGLAVVRGRRKT